MYEKFNQEVSKFGKKDAIVSLCVYVALLAWSLVFWAIMSNPDRTTEQGQIITKIVAFTLTALVIAIVILKKQKISSIGFHKEKIKSALLLGLAFSMIPLLINLIFPAIFYDLSFAPARHMLHMLLYLLIMAAYEDIFFIGFLQTRLYGLFKTDRVAISAGAALFSFIHVPAALADGGFGLIGLEFIIYLVGVFFIHYSLVLVFKRYYSIFTVTLIHLAINWSYISIWRWTAEINYGFFWGSVASLVFIIAVNIWSWQIEKRASKGV